MRCPRDDIRCCADDIVGERLDRSLSVPAFKQCEDLHRSDIGAPLAIRSDEELHPELIDRIVASTAPSPT